MANSSLFLFTFFLFTTALIISSTSEAAIDHKLSWVVPKTSRCEGLVGECVGEDEFGMDSEINRRILATSQYISYDALQSNSVPCSRRGASYYNCQQGGEANPYNRGCSAITRCRS